MTATPNQEHRHEATTVEEPRLYEVCLVGDDNAPDAEDPYRIVRTYRLTGTLQEVKDHAREEIRSRHLCGAEIYMTGKQGGVLAASFLGDF